MKQIRIISSGNGMNTYVYDVDSNKPIMNIVRIVFEDIMPDTIIRCTLYLSEFGGRVLAEKAEVKDMIMHTFAFEPGL